MTTAPAPPDPDALDAARQGDHAAFDLLVGPFRRELLAHCYRMLGSIHDADDALQDTLLRAWRGLPGFAGRSSLRTWLHRIATNRCLAMVERDGRRLPPVDPGVADGDLVWLEPFPDDDPASPAGHAEQRESLELAFVTAVQHLPAKERATLLLRDVLGFSTAATAEVLDTSEAAIMSRLQRARGRLRDRLPGETQQATLRTLGDARQRELVTAYVDAWERADPAAILALVTEDATYTMPPDPLVVRGRTAIARFLVDAPLRHRWRAVPTRAAGQLAFGFYLPDGDGWAAHSLDVLTLRDDRIARVTAFMNPDVVTRLGLPARLH